MKKPIEQFIYPVFVGLLSIWNIIQNFEHFFLTSVIVSIIGLVGVGAFFMGSKKASLFIYIWISAQIITILTSSWVYYTEQFTFFRLQFHIGIGNIVLAVNFIPIFMLAIYIGIRAFDIVGKKVAIRPIKAGSGLAPIDGEIVEFVSLPGEGSWFKIAFNDRNDRQQKFVLIKPNGKERLSRQSPATIVVREGTGDYPVIDDGKAKLM